MARLLGTAWVHPWYEFTGNLEEDAKAIQEYDWHEDALPKEFTDIDYLVESLIQADYKKRPTAGDILTRLSQIIRSYDMIEKILTESLAPSVPDCFKEWTRPDSCRKVV